MKVKKKTIFNVSNHLMKESDNKWTEYMDLYKPFMINRLISQDKDLIFLANEMNMRWGIPKKYQYEFYLNIIPNKSRYNRYTQSKTDKVMNNIRDKLNINMRRSAEVYEILKKEGRLNDFK